MDERQMIAERFSRLGELIETMDEEALLGMFQGGNVSVNVPRYGKIGNNIVFMRYIGKVRTWLHERNNPRFEYWGAVWGKEYLGLQTVLYFDVEDEEFNYKKTLHIPIGVVAKTEGGKIVDARVYYCTMWVAGHNMARPAMLNEDKTLLSRMPASEQKYFKCLWEGDTKTMLEEVFDPEGYFMGTAYSFNQGKDLIKTFDGLFSGGRKTELRMCNAFEDDDYLVVEYMNHRSGDRPNTPSSGMAIYGKGKGEKAGKILFARLAGDSIIDHCLWPTL